MIKTCKIAGFNHCMIANKYVKMYGAGGVLCTLKN
jgi:poly-gamma-glutamate capsule biosynthesis protein CapA/YwtB (metallophosphatase superfamily)